MRISPDDWIFWEYGIIKLNATIVFTWAIMLVMILGSKAIARKLTIDVMPRSRWQTMAETIVIEIQKQISEVGIEKPGKYLPFLGTLFLFISVANLANLFPGYEPPTASLSTTAALAVCVFVAVPVFGISELGFKGYMKSYLQPTFIMLPFNIISEISRTLAMAVRLFGNMMSGTMILAMLLSIVPIFFPIIMRSLGLLTGMVQAYIFSVLATVYIAAATRDNFKSKLNSN